MTFQCAMDIILACEKRQHELVYKDAVSIFFRCSAAHAKGWYDVEAEEMLLHFRRNRLSWTRGHPGTTIYWEGNDICCTEIKVPDDSVRAMVISETVEYLPSIDSKVLLELQCLSTNDSKWANLRNSL